MSSLSRLDLVTLYIVQLCGQTGLYHYNKLTYLFEYFFIKNFGKRYTGELFIKFPHGPVIANYKAQIIKLSKAGFIDVDQTILQIKRRVDDYAYRKVWIKSRKTLDANQAPFTAARLLIEQVVRKYGALSVAELEKIVYKTEPVIHYLEKQNMGLKKKAGGYILKDGIRLKDYKNDGRALALKHLEKYPDINFEQQAKVAKELEPLSKLRPKV